MHEVAVVAHRGKVDPSTLAAIKSALADAGVRKPSWYMVDKGSKAKGAAKKARTAGADVVIVCGGDGTVRAASEALAGTTTALAVVPTGTANLFADALDIPKDPVAGVALALGSSRRTIDTGRCNDMSFNVMAGAGLDAGMIDGADRHKERLGTLAYVRAGVREARGRTPFDASVVVDGDDFYDGPATCVLVGNMGSLKGGLVAFPEASPTDGRLDVAVVTAVGVREWARVLIGAARHRQHRTGLAHVGQGASISVRLGDKHRYELDGGCKGARRRLEFAVRPMSLNVCAPPAR